MFSEVTLDAQTRNAIYGYVAEADNQTKAAYMREVVMPGMRDASSPGLRLRNQTTARGPRSVA